MQYLRSICILFLVGLCSVSLAFSQAVSGSLVGTITDASGSVVANAQVTMTETNTGVSRTTKTGEAGNYVFADVPQGTYSVSVEVSGFKKAVRSGVEVLVNTTMRVDLTLQPGSITEVIMVSAEAAILQTDRSDVSAKIEEATLANLPLQTQGGRNFQALLNYVPGTTRAFFSHSQFFNAPTTLHTQLNRQPRLAPNLPSTADATHTPT